MLNLVITKLIEKTTKLEEYRMSSSKTIKILGTGCHTVVDIEVNLHRQLLKFVTKAKKPRKKRRGWGNYISQAGEIRLIKIARNSSPIGKRYSRRPSKRSIENFSKYLFTVLPCYQIFVHKAEF